MNELVKKFIHELRLLSPGDRLMAMHEYESARDTLLLEAISQAQQSEKKPA